VQYCAPCSIGQNGSSNSGSGVAGVCRLNGVLVGFADEVVFAPRSRPRSRSASAWHGYVGQTAHCLNLQRRSVQYSGECGSPVQRVLGMGMSGERLTGLICRGALCSSGEWGSPVQRVFGMGMSGERLTG